MSGGGDTTMHQAIELLALLTAGYLYGGALVMGLKTSHKR